MSELPRLSFVRRKCGPFRVTAVLLGGCLLPRAGRIPLLFLACALTLGSCATLFNDKEPLVGIESQPGGAEVYIDGEYVGTTPLKVHLSIHQEHTIEFRKEGFAARTFTLSNEVGALWIVLDIVSGLIPLIIDAATGNWLELKDEDVHVVLSEST